MKLICCVKYRVEKNLLEVFRFLFVPNFFICCFSNPFRYTKIMNYCQFCFSIDFISLCYVICPVLLFNYYPHGFFAFIRSKNRLIIRWRIFFCPFSFNLSIALSSGFHCDMISIFRFSVCFVLSL